MAQFTFGLHVLCRRCKGARTVPVRVKGVRGLWRTEHVPCRVCNATGYMLLVNGREIPDPFTAS